MKKIILSTLILFLLIGCRTSTKRLNPTGIEEISYKELTEYMNDQVEFMLYIGRPDCGDCMAFYPQLEDYLKAHDAGVYYLNIKAYRDAANADDASQEEKNFYENLKKTFKYNWTPTMEIITNGKIGKQYQYLDEDYYEIEDRAKQIERREEFKKEFKEYMNAYFEGD